MSLPVVDFIEKVLGLPRRGEDLFEQALTHSSYTGHPHYERLEFLGDAVLKLVASAWIYERFAALPEGEMTKIRARIVSDATLSAIARRLDLPAYMRFGKAEERTGGRKKVGNIAASLEAVFAAVHLAYGLEVVTALIRQLLETELVAAASAPGAENSKALLQELTQERFGTLPTYRVVGGEGPLHHHTFFVEVEVEGSVLGHGKGQSKKQAEQAAAREALVALERSEPCAKP
ncbi:Ribonuclease 3 [compost metagenome]